MDVLHNHIITLPNSADSFIVDEIRDRLAQGHTVRIAFGGESMLPLIRGTHDKIELSQVVGPLRKGDVCLFLYQGRCVVHRLISIKGENLVFRGDNCARKERVARTDVVARLSGVVRPDGNTVECDSFKWRSLSMAVAVRRTVANTISGIFSRRRRQWERWVYFAVLLTLMWAPVGLLGVPLDNFIFGLRADHLLHASVYIPCAIFVMDFFRMSRYKMFYTWLASLSIGLFTELVQYLLPYRGFDVNDLVANSFGVTLGVVVILVAKRNRR